MVHRYIFCFHFTHWSFNELDGQLPWLFKKSQESRIIYSTNCQIFGKKKSKNRGKPCNKTSVFVYIFLN